MSKKIQETSREAFHSLDPDKLNGLQKKIALALQTYGTGTYEDIAGWIDEEPIRVWKRMSELNRYGMAHRTGDRKIMKSNRQGFVWAYGPGEQDKIQKKERVMKGKSVVDFSKAINQINQSSHTIERLF